MNLPVNPREVTRETREDWALQSVCPDFTNPNIEIRNPKQLGNQAMKKLRETREARSGFARFPIR